MSHNKVITILLLIGLFFCIVKAAAKPDLVIEIFRHGARGPLTTAFDPNPSYWQGTSQLTPSGMRMQYLLGAAIRDRYSDLLSSYDPTKIYVRSTDLNRTLMSAYSHMYGVYANKGPGLTDISNSTALPPYDSTIIQQIVKSLNNQYALPGNLQVVPVHTVPETEDSLLLGYNTCPMAMTWLLANLEDTEMKEVFNNDMKDVVDYLKSQNVAITNLNDLYLAGDNAIANLFEGIDLPGHVDPKSQFYKDMKFASEWFISKLLISSPIQTQLYPLNVLYTISDYMNAVLNGKNSPKFVFLSAHDISLMTILSAFRITTKDCMLANYRSEKQNKQIPYPHCSFPQYASNLIFEFYLLPEPHVVFYYNGVAVPFCGSTDNTCSYNQFVSYIKQVTNNYSANDFYTMCNFQTMPKTTNSDPEFIFPPSNIVSSNDDSKSKPVIITLSVVCALLIGVLIFTIHKIIQMKKLLNVKKTLERVKEREHSSHFNQELDPGQNL